MVLAADRVRVSVADIRTGATCEFDIHDEKGFLLLGAGRPLTDELREQLGRRGVTLLEVNEGDYESLTGKPYCKPSTGGDERAADETPEAPADSLQAKRCSHGDAPYCPERQAEFDAELTRSVDLLAKVGVQIKELSVNDAGELCEIPHKLLSMLFADADQSIATFGKDAGADPLGQRSSRMSLMTINTAIELNLDESEVVPLGTAALLHDIGLYTQPPHFQDPTVALKPDEVDAYRQHPMVSAELLSNFSLISEEVLAMIRQVHESPDGTGYPRGIRANALHPHTSILRVVDCYLTLTEPGPNRAAVLPHDALALMLYGGRGGRFDSRTMAAFLRQLTLFPINSEVLLDNGSQARVLRRDGDHYATPVVVVDTENDGKPFAIRGSERSIVRPANQASTEFQRIPLGQMESMSLSDFERTATN